MLYEYAVDPSLLSDIHHCRTIFDNFKPERGKLIADVPRKWQQEAFRAINRMPSEQCRPVMRKTLKGHLDRLMKEALCSNRQTPQWDRKVESWLAHALAAQGAQPYAAILAADTSREPVCTYALGDLFLSAPECWNALTEIAVPRTAQDIVEALMPLFRISKQIMLIDRHLYPGEVRARRVLREIIRRVPEYNFGRGVSKITLHVSDHRQDMQSSMVQHLLPHLPRGLEVACCAWPKATEHDRFAVTDVGGIQLGAGFDERTHDGTQQVLMSLIDNQQRRRLLATFSSEPTYRASIRSDSLGT